MKITLFVRNDIEMPLGKAAAQCAHALNAACLDRMQAEQQEHFVILRPTEAMRAVAKEFEHLEVVIEYGDLHHIESNAEHPLATIKDRGRTVFNEPTVTVSWTTTGWGDIVPREERLPFNSGEIPYKQPIFINRSTQSLTETTVMTEAARASTLTLLNELKHTDWNVISLERESPFLEWLQHGFGKTVVGCKKDSHYEKATAPLRELGNHCLVEYSSDDQGAIMAYTPLKSDLIEAYTRTKYTRLLDNL
ncbi:hypothetical protein OTK49_02700 [Vibrio coralliirubri]|uniref:peptidyl-tRNA hydrolase n=1 Tax=Vibrio coralliirubri TaxID=1516159 RepID=UPI00228369C0|nr:peptidyl-tRNA hydrolase [Vibrio coralliirubri]MCY9861427.1 hypothetical protein [Vibrio coralliirubri]